MTDLIEIRKEIRKKIMLITILPTLMATLFTILFLIPQLHNSATLLGYFYLTAVPVAIVATPVYKKFLKFIYWPAAFIFIFSNIAYCIFYPLCLSLISSKNYSSCKVPDTIRYCFLADHLLILVALILNVFFSEEYSNSREKMKKMILILFSGIMGYILLFLPSDVKDVDNECKEKENKLANTVKEEENTPAQQIDHHRPAQQIDHHRPAQQWTLIVITISITTAILIPALTNLDNFSQESLNGFISFNFADNSFGYLLIFLINIPYYLMVGKVGNFIDDLFSLITIDQNINNENSYQEKIGKFLHRWFCKIIFSFVLSVNVSSGILLSIFLKIIS